MVSSIRYWALAFAAWAFLAYSAGADRVVLRGGGEGEGRLVFDVLRIESSEGALLEIPRNSIRRIEANGERLRIHLIDGSTVSGRPLQEDIGMDRGLFVQRWNWTEIALLELAPPDLAQSPEDEGFLRVDDHANPSLSVQRPCPLRLELDIGSIRDLQPGRKNFWSSRKSRGYYCDDATVSQVRVRKEDEPHGQVLLTWYISVYVRPSFDRLVDIELDLLNGDSSVIRMLRRSIEVEEEDTREVRMELRLSEQRYVRLFGDEEESPRLRITLAVSEG